MNNYEVISQIKQFHFEICGYADEYDVIEASAYHWMGEHGIDDEIQLQVIQELKNEYGE